MARRLFPWDASGQDPGGQIDDLFDHMLGFGSVPRYGLQPNWRPSVDVFRERDGIAVVAELPGVDQPDVRVTVERDRLRIAGTRRPPALDAAEPQRLEIDYGPFERLVALPPGSDGARITARLRHGLLTVHVPIRSGAHAVRVHVANRDSTNE
jgi:HSP20 family protein